jgi:hypothetical protein
MVFMRGRTSLVFLITSSIVSFLSSNQRLKKTNLNELLRPTRDCKTPARL